MKLLPLVELKDGLAPGQPLPWGVRDQRGNLLLGKGHLVGSEEMLQALLDRGVFVDAQEAANAAALAPVPAPAPSPLAGTPFERWDRLCANLAAVLSSPRERHFLQRVRDAALHVHALSEMNTDLLLFLILRQDHGQFEHYGTTHALHVACICSLLAQRLGWDADDRQRAIGAALTMNLAIIELQGRLACQTTPLTRRQREQIHEHPNQASMMLRAAGLDDEPWLSAVEDHHERHGGGGYPMGRLTPGTLSQLLRLTDQFTAKHSARATRPALPAQLAARQLFMENPGDPMAAMLIKAFGIYPPGCLVRLASAELGIVVRRGSSANAPMVATLTDAQGRALPAPRMRDSAQPAYAVQASVPEPATRLRIAPQALYPEALAL
ncbi:HD-GYP domain-containing protein [Aquabacterium sp.]|uniref:HD-GYP domain-containing protein n=1 Tax=Aquabacterium sp. TaxID=1872578 RepID=UPI002C9428F7|nr:HD domain-containing phosphohydrolase [Aquabacterium sp.]HSW04146.1 HD domain-containing phosphohydrolase [Aquabacterium sp.]